MFIYQRLSVRGSEIIGVFKPVIPLFHPISYFFCSLPFLISCTLSSAEATSSHGSEDGGLDDEYGGRLRDEQDPFQGTGALDLSMAASKKA